MAVDRKQFINNIDTGLKSNEDFTKFYLNCKIDGKAIQKVFSYTNKDWNKKTLIDEAKFDTLKYKKKIQSDDSDIDENIKFDIFITQFFKTTQSSTSYSKDSWLNIKKSHYQKHIKPKIGNKKVTTIRQMHIKSIIQDIKDKGFSSRTQKTTLEVLNPVFKSAIANRIISFNPCDSIVVTRPKTKKKVQQASLLLKDIYDAIMNTFKDDIFFKALYLFALQGRRKSEILTMKWKNIDFDNMLYTLPQTKNGEEQTFMLPDIVAELLLSLESNQIDYVFESPSNPNEHIKNIQAQTNKLKKALDNKDFGIHYLRNVVVSAMAEQGVSAAHLSAALGHSNLYTMEKYLSINYTKGSQVANETIKGITDGQ